MLLFLILSMVIYNICQKYWLNQKLPATFSALTGLGMYIVILSIIYKEVGVLINTVILMGLAIWLSKRPGYGVLIITVIYLVVPRISVLYGTTNGFSIAPPESIGVLKIFTIILIVLIVLIYEFVKYKRTDEYS